MPKNTKALLTASVNRGKIDVKKIVMFGRDYKNFSSEDYRDDVSLQQWMSTSDDPNILMSDFVWRLDGSTERHAPTKKLSHEEVKLRLKPWITNNIQKLMRIRDRLYARKKENRLMRGFQMRIKECVIK